MQTPSAHGAPTDTRLPNSVWRNLVISSPINLGLLTNGPCAGAPSFVSCRCCAIAASVVCVVSLLAWLFPSFVLCRCWHGCVRRLCCVTVGMAVSVVCVVSLLAWLCPSFVLCRCRGMAVSVVCVVSLLAWLCPSFVLCHCWHGCVSRLCCVTVGMAVSVVCVVSLLAWLCPSFVLCRCRGMAVSVVCVVSLLAWLCPSFVLCHCWHGCVSRLCCRCWGGCPCFYLGILSGSVWHALSLSPSLQSLENSVWVPSLPPSRPHPNRSLRVTNCIEKAANQPLAAILCELWMADCALRNWLKADYTGHTVTAFFSPHWHCLLTLLDCRPSRVSGHGQGWPDTGTETAPVCETADTPLPLTSVGISPALAMTAPGHGTYAGILSTLSRMPAFCQRCHVCRHSVNAVTYAGILWTLSRMPAFCQRCHWLSRMLVFCQRCYAFSQRCHA